MFFIHISNPFLFNLVIRIQVQHTNRKQLIRSITSPSESIYEGLDGGGGGGVVWYSLIIKKLAYYSYH